MNRRECLGLLAAVAGLPLGLSGCAREAALRVGLHPWPGYETLFLAREFGWLPAGVALRPATSAGDSLAALRRGELDGAALTLDEVLKARAEGLPLSVVLVFNDSLGADMVLARPEIDSLGALAGARIAVEHGTGGSLVLHQLLKAAGLAPEAVTQVNLAPPRQLAAWQRGEIDAAVSYAPQAHHLLREGARRLYDSRDFPEMIIDVLAMRRDRLRWRTAVVQALVVAHFRGLAHLRRSREDAMRRIAAWRELSLAEVQASYAGMELPGLTGNRHFFGADGRLLAAAAKLNALMVASGLLAAADDLSELVTDRYLPRRGGA